MAVIYTEDIINPEWLPAPDSSTFLFARAGHIVDRTLIRGTQCGLVGVLVGLLAASAIFGFGWLPFSFASIFTYTVLGALAIGGVIGLVEGVIAQGCLSQ